MGRGLTQLYELLVCECELGGFCSHVVVTNIASISEMTTV